MENEKYIITVSEPWDFNNFDEGNIIRGEIVDFVEGNCLLFKSDNVLDFNGLNGCILVLFARFRHISPLLKSDTIISVNGGLLLSEYHEGLSLDFLKKNSKFVLIGSLSLG